MIEPSSKQPGPQPLHGFVFLGGFLTAFCQPLFARAATTQFGGDFAVWATVSTGGQLALALGYWFAYRSKGYRAVLSLLCLFPMAQLIWLASVGFAAPAWPLALYGVFASAPLFCFGITLVTAQARTTQLDAVYATSNRGALLALGAFMFVADPLMGLLGSIYFATIAASLWAALGWWTLAHVATVPVKVIETSNKSSSQVRFIVSWALSLLTVTTSRAVSEDLGSVPVAWCLPLVFLMWGFATRPTVRRPLSVVHLAAALGLVLIGFSLPSARSRWISTGLLLLGHWQLTRLGTSELRRSAETSRDYVLLTLAGALGSTTALIAPFVLSTPLELPLAALVLATGVVWPTFKAHFEPSSTQRIPPRLPGMVVAIGMLVLLFWWTAPPGSNRTIARLRSPFATYRITEQSTQRGVERRLVQAGTQHGRALRAPTGVARPIGYFDQTGAIAGWLSLWRDSWSGGETIPHVLIVGLGIGSAAPLLPNTAITYIEIDPLDVQIAQRYFSFLRDRDIDIRVGDARQVLLRDPNLNGFDLIFLDAFTGGAIPSHLLTREAFELYQSRLSVNGTLLAHISNATFDLAPVIRQHAMDWEQPLSFHTSTAHPPFADPSTIAVIGQRLAGSLPDRARNRVRWTDDRSNWMPVLRWDLLWPVRRN